MPLRSQKSWYVAVEFLLFMLFTALSIPTYVHSPTPSNKTSLPNICNSYNALWREGGDSGRILISTQTDLTGMIKTGYITLFSYILKSDMVYSHQLNFKNNGLVLVYGTKTVSCLLLLRMARMKMD